MASPSGSAVPAHRGLVRPPVPRFHYPPCRAPAACSRERVPRRAADAERDEDARLAADLAKAREAARRLAQRRGTQRSSWTPRWCSSLSVTTYATLDSTPRGGSREPRTPRSGSDPPAIPASGPRLPSRRSISSGCRSRGGCRRPRSPWCPRSTRTTRSLRGRCPARAPDLDAGGELRRHDGRGPRAGRGGDLGMGVRAAAGGARSDRGSADRRRDRAAHRPADGTSTHRSGRADRRPHRNWLPIASPSP